MTGNEILTMVAGIRRYWLDFGNTSWNLASAVEFWSVSLEFGTLAGFRPVPEYGIVVGILPLC